MICKDCTWWQKSIGNDEFDFSESDFIWGVCNIASGNETSGEFKAIAICLSEGVSGELMTRDCFLCSSHLPICSSSDLI